MNPVDISQITEQQLVQRFGAPMNKLFQDADVDRDGHISAAEAKNFFPRFHVPQQVLKNVWSQSSRTPGGLTRGEFDVAMRHIWLYLGSINHQQQQQQQQQNTFVPIRSSPSPSPMSMMTTGGGMSGMTPPITPTSSTPTQFNFSISADEKSAYEKHFYGIAQGSVTITEQQAMPFFQRAQLDDGTLRQIYHICDFEKDGLLDRDEFVIAFHLIRLKRKSPMMAIPDQVPDILVPPNKRMLLNGANRANVNGGGGGGMMMNRSPMMMGSGPSPGPGPNHASSINVTGMNASQVEMHVNRLMDETKELSANVFSHQQQNEQNRVRLEELSRQKMELEQQLDRERNELRMAEQEKLRFDMQSAELESKVTILTNDKNEMMVQIERLRNELAELNNVRTSALQTEQELASEMNDIRLNLQSGLDDFVQIKEQITELNFKIEEMQAERGNSEQSVFSKSQESARLQNELRNAQSAYNQLNSEIAALNTRQQEFDRVAQTSQSELDQLVNQNNELKQKLFELQNQAQSNNSNSFSSAKLLKLREILKKTETFVSEFEQTMKQEFPDQASSISSVSINSASFVVPSPSTSPVFNNSSSSNSNNNNISNNMPVSVPTPPSPVSNTFVPTTPPVDSVAAATTERPKSNSSFDDFDSEFDVDFSAPVQASPPKEQKPQSSLPPPPPQATILDDDWGTTFDDGNTADDAWGTFDTNNSKITSSAFSDAWSDDFGSSPTTNNNAPVATKAATPVVEEDDWANF